MMDHLWVYTRGELDASGNVISLYSTGPDMCEEGGGKTGAYKDVVEFRSDDVRTLTGYRLGDNGDWQKLMSAQYRRKK